MSLESIDNERRLYVIKSGAGFSSIGWEYADSRARAVAQWSKVIPPIAAIGTAEHYAEYERIMAYGAVYAEKTGTRCEAELIPALIPLERKRIEVEYPDKSRARFIVGKSTGWMPCHLEIKRRDSHGGGAVYWPDGTRVVRTIEVRA